MVTKFSPPGYVNNYEKNRYLEKLSKTAVDTLNYKGSSLV